MNRRLFPLLGALLVVAGVVVALVAISSSDSSTSAPRDAESASSQSSTSAPSNGETEGPATSVPAGGSVPQSQRPYTTPDMPVSAKVSRTEGLVTGDVVSVTATPANGSQAFAVEARLCRGDVAIAFDGQLFPTRAGLCVPKPFTEGTDALVEVLNQPPYGPISLSFKVGTGSQTFTIQDGSQSTITCDSSHPCQLVLKLQYPNGFGFQGVPLTFR